MWKLKKMRMTILGKMEDSLEQAFENKFLCQTKFAQEIEKIVLEQKTNYIDSVVFYCDKNNIDLESVSKLISKPLKEKIKCEAMELNFLKKSSRAKLIF